MASLASVVPTAGFSTNPKYPIRDLIAFHHAISVNSIGRDFHHSHYRHVVFFSRLNQLFEPRAIPRDEVVSHHNGKRLIPHDRTGTRNGMAEAKLFFLAYFYDINHLRRISYFVE